MPDKNFEEQMEEILGKLQMQPADEVWHSVEKRIAKKDRRRSVVWLFLLMALLGASTFFYFQNENQDLKKIAKAETNSFRKNSNMTLQVGSVRKNNRVADNNIVRTTLMQEKIHFAHKLLAEQGRSNQNEPIISREPIEVSITAKAAEITKQKSLKQDENEMNDQIKSINTISKKDEVKTTAPFNEQSLKKPTTNTETASVQVDIEAKRNKSERGLLFSAGSLAYSRGFAFLNFGNNDGSFYAANSPGGAGNFTVTTQKQHSRKGYQFGAGFFIQRNYKYLSFQSGGQFEYAQFENYQTTIAETFSNSTSVQSVYSIISSSMGVVKSRYSLTSITIPFNLSGTLIKGNGRTLSWTAGLPQQFIFAVNTPKSNSVSILKKFNYSPALQVGFNYSSGRKMKMEAGPFLSVDLRSFPSNSNEQIHFYRTGLQLKYFLR